VSIVAFLKATGERAIGMFSGSLASLLIADGGGLFDVGWGRALGASGMAALLSVLASFSKRYVGPEGPGLTETLVEKDGWP
jgi:Putative lactococcus lactis phage r1t holin